MNLSKWIFALVVVSWIAACGGGGGNPGTSSAGSGGTAVVVSSYPTLTPSLQTSAGVVTSSIDATSYTLLKVALKDPSGAGIAGQVISVNGDLTKLSFPEGNAALTDSTGTATIKVSRASLNATGAGAMTVSYDYKPGLIASYSGSATPPTVASVVAAYIGYQVVTANITLTDLNVGSPATMPAYGTRQVSVTANINGSPATTTPVTVTFTATCGQVNPGQAKPITATTDSSGKAMVTYSATDEVLAAPAVQPPSTLGCSGKTVQITASTSGATAVSQGLTVTAAPATSMSFVSAAPTRIYLANACGVSPSSVNPSCATQSTLTFQLLNQSGEGIPGQSVVLTLKSLNGGTPKAAFDTLGSIASIELITDSKGKVSQPVYSGSVPTNVIVNAALKLTPSIQTDSSVLAIASGRPAQSRLSLALEKLAIEGFNVDGQTAGVTLSLSDRNGNPVPDGTVVNFVTEAGVMIPPTCVTGATESGDSRCSVSYRSQGTRPANGLVTILAYAAGEEDFADTNGNNVYDCGEPFTDLGIAYRDNFLTTLLVSTYTPGAFTVPRAGLTSSCVTGAERIVGDGVPGTHDRVWGAADVRQQAVMVLATGDAVISGVSAPEVPVEGASTGTMQIPGVGLTISDGNGNSLPTGTSIELTAVDNTFNGPVVGLLALACNINGSSKFAVTNSLSPVSIFASLSNCIKGDQLVVKVTSPLSVVTSRTFSF